MSAPVNHPPFKYPPIQEVVCGFFFEPLPLDSMLFGIYWSDRKEEYPRREIQPALVDGPGIFLGPANRIWFVSEDDETILQMQHDRFYMNWRRRGGRYPRFRERPNEREPGLKVRAIAEFNRFAAFCKSAIGKMPNIRRIELTKIDLLKKNLHYKDTEDLGNILKVAKAFEGVQKSDSPQLNLQLTESFEDQAKGTVLVSIRSEGDQVRIEARVITLASAKSEEELGAAFDLANIKANGVFFDLINSDELGRFNKSGVE